MRPVALRVRLNEDSSAALKFGLPPPRARYHPGKAGVSRIPEASNLIAPSDASRSTCWISSGTTAVPSAPQTLGGIDGTPSSGNLTGSFTRAGSTVASRVFTATHSGGNLTYSAGADSGEATTHSATGSDTLLWSI